MNGIVKEQPRSITPSSYLGKRKRSESPEKLRTNGKANGAHATMNNLISEIKQHDAALSILHHTLPDRVHDSHSTKKRRLEPAEETIEGRLAAQVYTTTDELLDDLQQACADLKNAEPATNGNTTNHSIRELEKIDTLLSQYRHHSHTPTSNGHSSRHQVAEVMTVRSTTDAGTQQLFTGLRTRPNDNVKLEDIDVRKLPNGFDIVEADTLDLRLKPAEKDIRTFGDVFRQTRHSRTLEQPKASRGSQSTHLNFVQPFESTADINKDDYRVASLNAGSWLAYSGSASSTQQQPKPSPDLFKAAFSSFAPIEDSTLAIVSQSDRSRQWYRKYGPAALQKAIGIGNCVNKQSTSDYPEISDDYQDLIDNFIPSDEVKTIPSHQEEGDKDILDEVAELLQTLSSYQQMRDSERSRIHSAPVKPIGDEHDTFDLLRQQLKLLVAALPPFAVSKLNGDQLKDLNISTNILVRTPEVVGTGQPDEGTLSKLRAAQAQQAQLSRPAQPVQSTRNSYTAAPTPAATYNSQARSYNTNVSATPSMPNHAQRNAAMYNTPRQVQNVPAPYTQNQYRPQNTYPGATIQQFQRIQNGYAQAPNMQSPAAQTTYQQRPSQTPYQPQMQAQQAMQYTPARSASPAKPMANGASQHYSQQAPQSQHAQPQQRQTYQTPATSLLQNPFAQANQHATIQQVKAAHMQQQQQAAQLHQQSQSPQPQAMQGIVQTGNTQAQHQAQQRQASGTPQPQYLAQQQRQASGTAQPQVLSQPQLQSQLHQQQAQNQLQSQQSGPRTTGPAATVNGILNNQVQSHPTQTPTPTPVAGAGA